MIQRKQTLFLVLAIILSITCLCMPIGILEPVGMGTPTIIWNLGTVVPGSGVQFSNWPLFAFLAVSVVLEIIAIFTYHRRMLQAKLCSWSIVFSLAWYAYFAFSILNGFGKTFTFHLQFAACLPLVAIIALVLARRGVIQDEKLIRSADRIR